jgi:hypothetical protein
MRSAPSPGARSPSTGHASTNTGTPDGAEREADGAARRSQAPWTHSSESAAGPVQARAAARCKALSKTGGASVMHYRKTRADPRIVDEGQARYVPGSLRPRLGTPHTLWTSFDAAAGPTKWWTSCRARGAWSCRRVDRDLSGRWALAWCRLLRPRATAPSSKGPARRRVDALVAVVPADPIARRGIASAYLLNDTRAGSTIR